MALLKVQYCSDAEHLVVCQMAAYYTLREFEKDAILDKIDKCAIKKQSKNRQEGDDRVFKRNFKIENGVPTGIRTPVTAVKGRCPRPLDDRDFMRQTQRSLVEPSGIELTSTMPL